MTNSRKEVPRTEVVQVEQSLTKERSFKVTTLVQAHNMHDAIIKAKHCEPISVELVDYPEDNGVVGFNANSRR